MGTLLADRRFLIAASLLFAVNLVITNGTTPLFDQDEAAYAGFAHTMVESGDWVTPSFLWSEPHRKPPLHFWATAVSIAALGPTLLAVRLPTTLAYVATCLLVALWGGPLFGRRRALGAALIMATSLLPLFGKIALCDGLLLTAQTGAALALLRRLDGGGVRWAVALWGAVAAGLLIKGPPVLILVGGMGGVLALLHPHRRRLIGLHPWIGLPLACLPLVAWGWASWRADGGETLRWMLDWYVLRRAGGSVYGQTGPPGTYLLVFALLLLPWTVFLPPALVGMVRGAWRREPPAVALVAWMAAGWWFYELLPSKLPAYALGAAPALALSVAIVALPRGGRPTRSWVPTALKLAVGGTMLFFLLAWVLLIPSLRPLVATSADVSDRMVALAGPDGEAVFSRNFRLPSLPFYLGVAGVSYRQATADEDPAALVAGADPVVVLFDDEGYRAAEPALPGDGLITQSIDGWIPDKGKPIRYWIVANRAPDPAEQGRKGAGATP